MTDEDKEKLCKKVMAEVYKDGFNIYKCLNKLKKDMKLRVDFPPEAIIWTCESYLRSKPDVRNHWTWFVRVFKANSERYFSEQHVEESKKQPKRAGFSKSIKDIMKGM